MVDQYIISAILTDDNGRHERVIKVTEDLNEVNSYDVTPYFGTEWQVWLEHYIVDDCIVIERRDVKVLYPSL